MKGETVKSKKGREPHQNQEPHRSPIPPPPVSLLIPSHLLWWHRLPQTLEN